MEESETTDKVVPSFTHHYCICKYWRAGSIIPAVPRRLLFGCSRNRKGSGAASAANSSVPRSVSDSEDAVISDYALAI